MYGQTLGRQSLTGPSMSGGSGFRPVPYERTPFQTCLVNLSFFC